MPVTVLIAASLITECMPAPVSVSVYVAIVVVNVKCTNSFFGRSDAPGLYNLQHDFQLRLSHYLWAEWIRLTRARETRFAGGLWMSSPNSCIAMHSLELIMCVRPVFSSCCVQLIAIFLLVSTCPKIVFGFSLSFHVCCLKRSILWCIANCCSFQWFMAWEHFFSFTISFGFHSRSLDALARFAVGPLNLTV